jgi:5-methylcytosine-specific restriction endonuclease McrA
LQTAGGFSVHRTTAPQSQTPPPAVPFGRAPYRTREWKTLRDQVFRRDDGLCRACGARIRGKDWRLGHERPHHGDEALFWDPSNLLLVCKRCTKAAAAEDRPWPTRSER